MTKVTKKDTKKKAEIAAQLALPAVEDDIGEERVGGGGGGVQGRGPPV